MNKIFYTKENLNKLKKSQNKFLILSIIFAALFVTSLVLSFVFATRENESFVKVVGSIIASLLICFLTLFMFIYADLKRKVLQFEQIFNDPGTKVDAVLVNKNNHIISLQDKSKVYELSFNINKQEKRYFLVSMFEFDLKINHPYKLTLVSGFIKGVEYEE